MLARFILLRRDEEGRAPFTNLAADGSLAPEDVRKWALFARWREQRLI